MRIRSETLKNLRAIHALGDKVTPAMYAYHLNCSHETARTTLERYTRGGLITFDKIFTPAPPNYERVKVRHYRLTEQTLQLLALPRPHTRPTPTTQFSKPLVNSVFALYLA